MSEDTKRLDYVREYYRGIAGEWGENCRDVVGHVVFLLRIIGERDQEIARLDTRLGDYILD